MRLQWKPRESVDHELIFGLIGLFALVTAALLPVDQLMATAGYRCNFREFTGYPCASCGATRAFVAAGHLRLGEAFTTSPLAAVVFLGLVAYVPYALTSVALRTKRLRISGVTRREGRLIAAVIVFLVLANWAYLILTLSPQ